MGLHDFVPELDCKLGEELLKPTKIYVKSVLSTLEKFEVNGLAHITGGGFIENIPRILPEGCGVEIELGSWEIPTIFSFLEEKGNLVKEEMFNIFNMGVGMTAIVKKEVASDVLAHLRSCGEEASVIGTVVNGNGVSFK
jgi:phosphoribosylformylglycinamidine cyclo-ligase